MPLAPSSPLSDDELESLMSSDHRLIARLAAELLSSRRELRDQRRVTQRSERPYDAEDVNDA